MTDEPKTDRRSQPKCSDCNHPKSFHGGGTTKCRALGCECETWVEPEVALPV